MISIIIPTLNEEHYLPKLLGSIALQDFKDYEVIVVDSKSEDNTKKIALSFKNKIKAIRFIETDKRNVSAQRNKGAGMAKGEILFFLDADGILPEGFLKKSIGELEKRKLIAASVFLRPISKHIVDHIFYASGNLIFYLLQKIYPHSVGSCIIAKREIHNKIKGFNPEIRLAEDHDYVNRASKHGKFGMLHTFIRVSTRRFEQEGRLKLGLKYFLAFFHRLFLGEIKSDVFKYKFGHYGKKGKLMLELLCVASSTLGSPIF